MLHDLFYVLHLLGMLVIVVLSLQLYFRAELQADVRKRFAVILMSAAHTQLLTGFTLFFLMMDDVNHMKIGIKMLLAIEVAVFATLYKRSLGDGENPQHMYPLFILLSALIVTGVAFLL